MQLPKAPAPPLPPPPAPDPSKPLPITDRVALFLRTRTKPTLPAGYQFGDAAWRTPSDTAADQLLRRGITLNVIEGDYLDTPEHLDSDAVECP